MMKVLIKLLLLVSILLSSAYALLYFKGKDFIEKFVIKMAQEEKLDLKLELSHFGLKGLVFDAVSIFDGAIEIEKIEIDYSFKLLKEKKVQDLSLFGLKIDLNKIKALKEWLAARPPSPANDEPLPFRSLSLDLRELKLPGAKDYLKLNKAYLEIDNNLKGTLELELEEKEFSWESYQLSSLKLHSLLSFDVKNSPLIDGKLSFEAMYQGKNIKITAPKLEFSENKLNFLNALLQLEKYHVPFEVIVFDQLKKTLEIKVRGLEDKTSPPLFTKLDLDLQGKMEGSDWLLPFQVHTSWQKKFITGTLQVKETEKNIDLNISKLYFADLPNGLLSLYPALQEKIQVPRGTMVLKALAQNKNDLNKVSLKLEAKDIDLNYEDIKLKKISSTQEFTDLLKARTKKNQKLLIKEIDAGFSLRDIDLNYQIKSKNLLRVESLKLNSDYAEIQTKSFDLIPEPLKITPAEVSLAKIQLQKVLALALKEDISATGELRGDLRLEFKNKVPVIVSGKLQSVAPGIIRYDQQKNSPLANANQVSVNILLDYLRDFNYQDLTMDIRSEEDGELYIIMMLLGKNPQVFNGKPLKFTLNLQLNWMKLLKSTMGTSQISAKLEEKILKGLTQ
jgi:hypothetical protein